MEDSFRQTRISGSDLSACLSPRPVDWGRHWMAEGAWPPDDGNGQALSWPPQLTSHEPCSVCACRQAGPRPGPYGSAHFYGGEGGTNHGSGCHLLLQVSFPWRTAPAVSRRLWLLLPFVRIRGAGKAENGDCPQLLGQPPPGNCATPASHPQGRPGSRL